MSAKCDQALLDVLKDLRQAFPHLRFGQMICTLAIMARDDEPESVWEMEDDELLSAARQMLASRRDELTVASKTND